MEHLMNCRELRELLNNLTEEQLDMPILVEYMDKDSEDNPEYSHTRYVKAFAKYPPADVDADGCESGYTLVASNTFPSY